MFKDFKELFIKSNQGRPRISLTEEKNANFSLRHDHNSKTSGIVIVNQKGGCGKTTTAINLSAALADKNFQVLLIDLDAQAHSSLGLGIDVDSLNYSIYDVIVKNLELERSIVHTRIDNLDIAPAISVLTGAQLEIADLLGRELILRTAVCKMINTNRRKYDYIIIDCSPSLNLLTINGLAAVKSLLIPIQTHYFSLEGMKELFSTIRIVKERLNFQLEILGILPTLFDSRTTMNKDVHAQIRDYFKEKVFKTTIRMNIKLAESQIHKKSIFQYEPNSNGARDYLSLAEEVISITRPEVDVVKNSEDNRLRNSVWPNKKIAPKAL